MDWYSRRVLSWELSTTLETDFCLSALNRALADGTPEIFNTDQGSQYTSEAFTDRLKSAGAAISMDGKGRAFDNIFIERLWRTVKYEEVFLKEYRNPVEARAELEKFFEWYNGERPQSAPWLSHSERGLFQTDSVTDGVTGGQEAMLSTSFGLRPPEIDNIGAGRKAFLKKRGFWS